MLAAAPATHAAAAPSRRVRADAQAPAARTGGGHANRGASVSGRAQARGRRWVARFFDAMIVVGTLPFLFILFVFTRWVGAFVWCLTVAYVLFEVHHPEMRG